MREEAESRLAKPASRSGSSQPQQFNNSSGSLTITSIQPFNKKKIVLKKVKYVYTMRHWVLNIWDDDDKLGRTELFKVGREGN